MYTFTFSPQQLQVIIASLDEVPAKHSRNALNSIEKQIELQKLKEEQEKTNKKLKEAEELLKKVEKKKK